MSQQKSVATYIEILRIEDWISKMPGFSIAAFVLIISTQQFYSDALVLSVLFLLGHLITGYVANDLADWELDTSAGDHRAMHLFSKTQAYLIFAVLVGLHIGIQWFIAGTHLGEWLFLVLIFALHMAYSFPPRLKAQGIGGVISSSINQWVVPFVILLLLTNTLLNPIGILLASWLFIVGCNGAIRHQLHDFFSDKGKVQNFVQRFGFQESMRLLTGIQLLSWLLPFALLGMTQMPTAISSIVILASFGAYHTRYYKKLKNYDFAYQKPDHATTPQRVEGSPVISI